MIELTDWLEYIKDHPLKFRFDGLHSRGRSSKSDFFRTVVEAAAADEQYMSNLRAEEYEGHEEEFDKAVEDREDHDGYLSRFCEYAEAKVSHKTWLASGLPSYDWDKAPIDAIVAVVDFFVGDLKDGYLWDWCVGDFELPECDEEYILKEHPPVAVWCNGGDYEIKIEDVFFLCPSCREPQTEEWLEEGYTKQNGYPHFYCSSCGSEMSVGPKEHLLDFFNALEITPYPFNPEKQEIWKDLMAARKAWGENKLELKVGDLVHIKVSEECTSTYGAPGEKWTHWKQEPGDLVKVTGVHEKSISYEYADGSGHGGITYDKLYGRPQETPCTS